MYKRDTEARSRTNFCRGKAISNIYSECLSVPLVIQHAPYYIVTCDLSCCTILFLRYLIKMARSFGKKVIEHKMCVLIFSTNSL
jgi:hypothetical protein